jgi:hypothetical protein
MKKNVVKTTKKYEYNSQGYLIKEVITEESYEENVITGGYVKSKPAPPMSPSPYVLPTEWKKTTGVPPYTSTISTESTDLTIKGDASLSGKTLKQIADLVQSQIELSKRGHGSNPFKPESIDKNKPC